MDKEKKEIESLLEDFHYVKEIISKNNYYISLFLQSPGMIFLSLLCSILITFISLYFYFSASRNLNLNSTLTRWIIAICFVLLFVIGGLIKWASWKVIFPDKPWPEIIKRALGIPLLKVYTTIITIILMLTVGMVIFKVYHFILITWAIGVGILYNLLGSFFNLSEIEFSGYWILATGLTSLIFITSNPVEALLWTAIIFGPGFFIIALISFIKKLKRQAKSE